jgi:hypothetical protein
MAIIAKKKLTRMTASIVPLITYFMIVYFITAKKVIQNSEGNSVIHQLMNDAHEMCKGGSKKKQSLWSY